MSVAYDAYIIAHKKYVSFGATWIYSNMDHTILKKFISENALYILSDFEPFAMHDESKYDPEEYEAYDNYFYNGGYSTEEGKKAFDKAFLHHIHHNPHHWQHWILTSYDDSKETKVIDMPDIYILEMICDWWSFSWKKYFESNEEDAEKYLYDVFDWDDNHRNIIFSEQTRIKVEGLLDAIRDAIPFSKTNHFVEKTES